MLNPLSPNDELTRVKKSLLPQVEWCLNSVRVQETGRRRRVLRTQGTNIVYFHQNFGTQRVKAKFQESICFNLPIKFYLVKYSK